MNLCTPAEFSESLWQEVDLRGLRCPLPVLRLARLARSMPSGTALLVRASDPVAAQDVPAFAQGRGWRIERQETTPELRLWLRL